MADRRWELFQDDLLDGFPEGLVMLTYLTDVRGERIVVVQVNWYG
ncbi:hypothetical protein ACFFS2_21990 [Streptomyces aurantiacus]|uniref:Uncharacterized protein n=1 Tax=Streptomyces aurantiacus TaxID=47760 RepID=A0A7G1PC19_9ACTN|nr:hypothetical protein [Streptomyces aurantiacus]BCL30615.1 hypothetical protein GCM10017557_54740 [Streptomyces aurantiacus]